MLEIKLRNGDKLLFGCIYKSPTQTTDAVKNNEKLNSFLQTICNKSYSHVCFVGDFNYRDINWNGWTTPHGENSKEAKFIEAVRDCFLFQHIEHPTRVPGNDKPSLIGLILTNEELQVSNIAHHSPLGKSDHDVITFNYHCYLDFSKPSMCYQYHNGDYNTMVDELKSSKWLEIFMSTEKGVDAEGKWSALNS